jgi:hypothetical protein
MKDPIADNAAVATVRSRRARDTHAAYPGSTGGNLHDGDGEAQSSALHVAPVGEDGGVHGQDVGHGQERGGPRAELRGERGPARRQAEPTAEPGPLHSGVQPTKLGGHRRAIAAAARDDGAVGVRVFRIFLIYGA